MRACKLENNTWNKNNEIMYVNNIRKGDTADIYIKKEDNNSFHFEIDIYQHTDSPMQHEVLTR